MDVRLRKRYERLVKEHMNASESLSAGLKALPDARSSFASTQAAWRFYKNEAITLKGLQEPLLAQAHAGVREQCDAYALCLHDWSRLAFKHANKADTYAITHHTDVGYDLQTSLLVSDKSGQPIAPVAQRLVSAQGSYASYGDGTQPVAAQDHLDEVSDCIEHLQTQGFAKPLVHIIDREADSVRHVRRWQAAGCLWLIRAKDNPTVVYEGQSVGCKQVAQQLIFSKTIPVDHKGKKCSQWVAEADVVIARAAKPSQAKGKKSTIKGDPVSARLVVSRIICSDGQVLAQWLLLTNVSAVSSATVALWYHWRWMIESFFKLMKSAGHHLESWQQESALAVAKRLLVASMACVTVWAIAADTSPEAQALQAFLIKLSGRQMNKRKPVTHPALLAGLWVFLSMQEVLQTYSAEELHALKTTAQRFFSEVV